jgi:hypothetical protein
MRRRLAAVLLTAMLLAAGLAQAANLNLAGRYDVTGTNTDGSRYAADLRVTRSGETWRFDWDSGNAVGVGLVLGDMVAVAYGASTCSVVGYLVQKNGDLDGLWASRSSTLGSELATGSDSPRFSHTVSGRNPDGSRYQGTLALYTVGPAYSLRWLIGQDTYVGLGVRRGNLLAVAYGSDSCGMVAYSLDADGTLRGDFTTFSDHGKDGKPRLGLEVARPR